MSKVVKILGHQSLTFKSVKSMRERFSTIRNALLCYKVNCDAKNDFDFFCLEILYESFLNKRTFETTYESLRSELFDAWEHAEYDLKKNYVEIALKPHKEEMKYFYDENNKIIRIAFFDELLNQLYENEMVIFERPQYFILENHFKDRMINILDYGYRPFEANFSSAHLLAKDDESFVLFSEETKCLYHHTKYETITYPLYKHIKEFDKDKLLVIAKSILTKDEKLMAESLVNSGYLRNTVAIKMNRFITKG